MKASSRKPVFSSDYRLDILACLGLVLLVFIPYSQVAAHRFIEFDDGGYLFYNTYIIKGLTWESVVWSFTNVELANWHPLTWLTHLVDRELFGPHPGAYLLANVAWHALATCMCYLAFYRVTGRRYFAFFVALCFAAHPTNVENVAWYSERKSLLNAVAWFASVIAYVRFIESRKFRDYGMTIIWFLVSLMCKPMSVTLPCSLVLLHLLHRLYRIDDRSRFWSTVLAEWRKIVIPPALLLLVSAYFSCVTTYAQTVAIAGAYYTLPMRFINVARSYVQYVEMFFSPGPLAVFYPLFYSELTTGLFLKSIAILLLLTATILFLAKRMPELTLGWLWFLGTMVPAVGLVHVGSQAYADRYLYIPALGLSFLFPVLFDAITSLTGRSKLVAQGLYAGLTAISLTLATAVQTSYWKDGITLFQHALSVTGDCYTSVSTLVVSMARNQRYKDAITVASSKIAISQNVNNRGKLYALKGVAEYNDEQYAAAIESAKAAIQDGNDDASPYYTLAMANCALNKEDESMRWLKEARTHLRRNMSSNYIDWAMEYELDRIEKRLTELKDARESASRSDSSAKSEKQG